jgi:hypothetical protein
VEASRAHSSIVKRVPHAAAVTRPEIVFAWRPAAERASNAGAGGFEALILIGLAIQHYGRIVIGGCAHAPIIRALKGVRTRRACPCGVDFVCGAVVPEDNVAGAEVAAQHFLDNTRATNANASLACLCTVFVMTNRIGMSGADLSPRSEVLRIALGTGGQDRGQTAYSHGLKAGSKLGLGIQLAQLAAEETRAPSIFSLQITVQFWTAPTGIGQW